MAEWQRATRATATSKMALLPQAVDVTVVPQLLLVTIVPHQARQGWALPPARVRTR